ncbi:DNA-binding response regulator [Alteromonas sediminis]|uniref:DNA-binding response regulator n=1 Tax=Alteromonas sediminis TaxID=2259342 RepID=A0A3N5YBF4_9ALTE|nr:response regulator transcription factor [Alteromonas sediminis]RPJ66305.1 DNA-binding response regulator [Alteromonas sediminis]
MHILIVEDDEEVSAFIHNGLAEVGHTVDVAHDGREGLGLAQSGSYDILILDRMLPSIDGVSLLQALRDEGIDTPTLFLSALDKVEDKVNGLRAGADDYLAKPFAFEELLARLDVMHSRSLANGNEPTTINVSDLSLNLITRRVKRGEKEIPLQTREFKLLEFLLRNQGQIVTRTMLLEKVWDYNFDPQTNIIDVHISRLRQKIDKGFPTPIIKTVRGAGYLVASQTS